MPEGVFLFIIQPVETGRKTGGKKDEKTIMLNIVGVIIVGVISCFDNAADNGAGGGR